jgi:hypothetical protein
LTPLGRKYVYANSNEEEKECIQEAFNNIEIFKQVFEYYSGGNLPENKYLFNTLQERFHLDSSFNEEFVSIYKENIGFLDKNGVAIRETHENQNQPGIEKSDGKKILGHHNKSLFVIMPFTEKTDKLYISEQTDHTSRTKLTTHLGPN